MEDISRYVSEGVDRAKEGQAYDVYKDVVATLAANPLPAKSHYGFGWIIYYAMHQSPDSAIAERKLMLAEYLKLTLEKPHKLHSMILTEAIRLYKNRISVAPAYKGKASTSPADKFSIVKFTKLWGIENLREGDWRRKEYEGKMLTSTAEKLITLYVDELEASSTTPDAQFTAVIDKAMEKYPDTFTLLSQRATLFILSGDKEMAKEMLRKSILLAPGKFFLWSKLAMLYPHAEQPRQNVALLYKALISPGPEQYKGRIRLALAEALCFKKQYGAALWELQKVESIYKANGWNLPALHLRLSRSIPEGTRSEDPASIYRSLEHFADDEIYNSLPACEVSKTYHKKGEPGAGRYGNASNTAWRVTDAEGKNYWIQPRRFNIPEELPLGTRLTLRLHNSRPVKATLIEN